MKHYRDVYCYHTSGDDMYKSTLHTGQTRRLYKLLSDFKITSDETETLANRDSICYHTLGADNSNQYAKYKSDDVSILIPTTD